MYFGLSEEQQFFKDNVNKFLHDHASLDAIKKIADSNNQKMKNAISSGILNLGINSLLVPEDYGGLGFRSSVCNSSFTKLRRECCTLLFYWIICDGTNSFITWRKRRPKKYIP